VTAYAMVGDKEKFLTAGFDDYISKPYHKEDLIKIVRLHLPQIPC
jgi:CheY-like chemotaxis protein